MKYKNNLIGAVFAFVLSVSAVGNLVTGYNLPVASMTGLFLWCAFCSLISAFLFGCKRSGTILLCLTVLVAPIIWKSGDLWDHLQSLCHIISTVFHNAYGWQIIGNRISNEVHLPLFVLSALVAISVSWVCCHRKNVFIAIPVAILPLAICMVTTDKAPDEIYLYLLMLGIAMLLMTDWTRRKDPEYSMHLSLRLAIPTAIAFALLFALNPQEGYTNDANSYHQEFVSWFQALLKPGDSTGSGAASGSSAAEKINLRHIGPKRNNSLIVMRVNAPYNGIVYLRGKDYDIYTGDSWESSANRQETFTTGGRYYGILTIKAYGAQDIFYLPYYSTVGIDLVGGMQSNNENLTSYRYSISRTPAIGSSAVPDSRYTDLPHDTLQWARSLDVIKDTLAQSQDTKISRIQSYVETSALYDLSTPRMGFAHDDFARWFLEESDTGYCIHFASAATVLLRAAGIPARYVEGYAVTCQADQEVAVYSKQAHAWAEYYDFDSGTWRILETTPADLHNDDPEPTVSTTPQDTEPATQPNQSQPETSVPQTSVETQPTVPDDPSDDPVDLTVNHQSFRLPDWAKTVFWIILAFSLAPLQSHIRMVRKRKQWNRGKPNEKLIARWKQIRKTAHILHCTVPEELEALAQRACFSQHRIQPEELQLFEDYRKELLETADSKPWYWRILLRWIFAIG